MKSPYAWGNGCVFVLGVATKLRDLHRLEKDNVMKPVPLKIINCGLLKNIQQTLSDDVNH